MYPRNPSPFLDPPMHISLYVTIFYNTNIFLIEFNLYFNSKKELYRSRSLVMYLTPQSRYICGTWISKFGITGFAWSLRLQHKNETKWWAWVRTYRRLKSSYFTCMSTGGFLNTILRIRNFIIRSVVTPTSKTISTNFSKYGHWSLIPVSLLRINTRVSQLVNLLVVPSSCKETKCCQIKLGII